MSIGQLSRRGLLAASAAALMSRQAGAAESAPMQAVLDYVQSQNTTGFLIVRDRRTVVERNWPVPADAARFRATAAFETNADGALLEDVASQQKSFVGLLAAIAVDKGVLDVQRPVDSYLGTGWSKATLDQAARIRVVDVLTMTSGLDTAFGYAGPPGETFLYNTPVYAVAKRVLAAAAGSPLDVLTREWLTQPAGMRDTAWRPRPAAFGDVGNPTGLVTSPRDTARFGQIILDGGRTADGRQIVSAARLAELFKPSPANPAYGRLWWLNGSGYTIRPPAKRIDGPLIPAAPADLVAALGALDRKLYVVPSRKLVVVRMGQAASDPDFDQQLWTRLMAALA